jgi:hypothetical protein
MMFHFDELLANNNLLVKLIFLEFLFPDDCHKSLHVFLPTIFFIFCSRTHFNQSLKCPLLYNCQLRIAYIGEICLIFRASSLSPGMTPLVKYSRIGVNQVDICSLIGNTSRRGTSMLSFGTSMTIIGRSLSKFLEAANLDKASA